MVQGTSLGETEMFIKVNSATVMFKAIESFKFDSSLSALVIRTVSGAEHALKVKNEKQAKTATELLLKRIALCESSF
jgi:hypothetical protein